MGGGISKHQEEVAAPEVIPVTKVPVLTEDKNQQEESKCPMHKKDGSYSFDWKQMFRAAQVHGPKGRNPLSQEQQDEAMKQSSSSSSSSPKQSSGGGCPVKHNKNMPKSEPSGFPVKGNASHPEYNVYSQPIDKTNQMPKGVKTQMPVATQQRELSTNRVSSTILKGGGDESSSNATTWTYPSPQQFYNALARKGKLDEDTSEEDMESVVALHNNMNEKTWAQVVEWEKQTYNESSTPKLLKFQGRPHDLSPKAGLKHYVFGHPLPYDRHDWTVLRDDGTTVRYVIDYYYDETRAQVSEASAKPKLHDRNASPSLLTDVRPALDGPSQFVARAIQMPSKIMKEQTTFSPMPLRGTPEMANQVKESIQVWQSIQQSRKQELEEQQEPPSMTISNAQAEDIALNFSKVLKNCRKQQAQVNNCESEEECTKASMDLTMCMGPTLCPVQHKSLIKALGEDDDSKIEVALETLAECVVFQDAQRNAAKQQNPSLFKA